MTDALSDSLKTRALILSTLFACALLALIGRLAFLQIVKHEELARLAERQRSKTIVLRPKRGPVLDRHGQALAVSSHAESLFALPARVGDPEGVAERLAPLLNEAPEEVRKRLATDRAFVWVKRKLSPSLAQAIRTLGEPGLGFVQESLRLYPNRELAAQVLGFEGVDGRGLEGIERAWDSHLAGETGLALVERDALGREVTGLPTVIKASTPGQGVALTLDTTIQYLAEKEVELAWRRTHSKAALAIVLDPRTGELLALAIRPTFNPNSFATASANEWRNRAVTDPFEPGSTFKVILAAGALEEGVARPTDRFYGEQGTITVASTVIHDWKRYGWLTFSEVLQNSSNVGAIKVGMALGRERYHRYITGFGFGSLTGVGLPGESRGQVRAPDRWSGLSLATLSIGQEASVTALQLIAAFGAVANGGRLMQPQVVRAVLDSGGREVRGFEPRAVRQVIAPETARALTQILTRVVGEGTGRHAAIPGYEVAGKTGTAQKIDPTTKRYSRAPGILSFAGFAPADDPRIAMLVLLDEPTSEKWGSEAAAPIFAALGGEVLRYLNVPPRDTPTVQIVRGLEAGMVVPVSRGGAAGGPLAEGQGANGVPLGAVAHGALDPDAMSPRMPAVVGKSLREALSVLEAFDIQVEVAGRGVVVAQRPAAGEDLPPGSVCRLELAPPTARQ
ncbi:MAG: PASTA domain-containing protein [Candidatus Rokubacteria bacterium]|nr:PASTA domain-containing protein [Candidatus Rokubacteria bacterium]